MRSVTKVRVRFVEVELEEETTEVRPRSELASVAALAARMEPGPVRPRALRAAVALRRAIGGAS